MGAIKPMICVLFRRLSFKAIQEILFNKGTWSLKPYGVFFYREQNNWDEQLWNICSYEKDDMLSLEWQIYLN